MHTIEPFYRWRKYYVSEDDFKSPFFGRRYSQTECSNTIYGSTTNLMVNIKLATKKSYVFRTII